MKFYQTRAFKALDAKWQKKLSAEGFDDIEDRDSPREMLKAWHGTVFKNNLTPDQFLARQEYYTQARSFLEHYKFKSPLDKRIWRLHSEGLSYRNIALVVHLSGDKTLKHINRLKGFMQGITFRSMTPDDKNFIYATWLKGIYYGSWCKEMDKEAFFSNYPRAIERIIANGTVVVACLNSDKSVIIGYAIVRPNTLDYIFVKDAWRRQGIAASLLKGLSFTTYTHTTELGRKLAKKLKLTYNPFNI